MKLGCQTTPTNEQHIRYLARYGVQAICGFPQVPPDRLYATVDELKAMREIAEKNGIPVFEDPPLARSMFAQVSIDSVIPSVFYKAVAELIHRVYAADAKNKRVR
jgi:type III secretion system FlhB-like substrate exporter